ncbi:MAG: hypothetical protein A2527_03075 [Candidatus Lambdaproteobacteria bacterium RIFOXYD2_FULL_50_16]|uniref:Urease accessory protein UreJ n=1 Tax=Candidatus Lambdaproteobacteria bacterium RIFOXYD2_FULL_50_16 TaxID=1817772 RepID=A0A1F6GG17_9PROT|nr:MAG: hypothetical protein A2527_03075 [Candidatus Lambdaproteobacteria bacterium RIFOXYD2_FULL_50_16]
MKKVWIATTLTLMTAWPAMAHNGATAEGFWAGVVHPLLGLDHLLAILAVGAMVWGQGSKARWIYPACFASALLIGAAVGMGSQPNLWDENLIAFSLIALGVWFWTQNQLSAGLVAGLTFVFGFFHGHAHGIEATGNGFHFLLGLSLATAMLHLTGAGLGAFLAKLGPKPLRLYGAITAAAGVVFWLS